MSLEKFPVTESTLAANFLAQFLHEKYALSAGVICKLFRTGINHLYFVTDNKEKYVFRVYTLNWRTKLEISEEVRLLNHLKENGIPIAYPIADKENNFIQELNAPEGIRFGVLFSFAKGGKIPHFSEQTSYHIGIAMAKMHQVTKSFILQRTTYTSDTLLTNPLASTLSFFANDSAEVSFVKKATQFLVEEHKKVKVNEIRHGAIHLDIWFDNMHLNGEDEITIFDFDFCGNGWLCYDIAYFVLQLYNTQPNEALYERKRESFIRGYESIQQISNEEQRIIPWAAVGVWLFYLGVQCDRFDNWSNIFLSQEHLKRFTGTLKKWTTYNKIEIEGRIE